MPDDTAVRAEVVVSLAQGRASEELGRQILAIGDMRLACVAPRLAPHERVDVRSMYVDRAMLVWPRLTGERPTAYLRRAVDYALRTWWRDRQRDARRREWHMELHT